MRRVRCHKKIKLNKWASMSGFDNLIASGIKAKNKLNLLYDLENYFFVVLGILQNLQFCLFQFKFKQKNDNTYYFSSDFTTFIYNRLFPKKNYVDQTAPGSILDVKSLCNKITARRIA